jgi:hypothetical protein
VRPMGAENIILDVAQHFIVAGSGGSISDCEYDKRIKGAQIPATRNPHPEDNRSASSLRSFITLTLQLQFFG